MGTSKRKQKAKTPFSVGQKRTGKTLKDKFNEIDGIAYQLFIGFGILYVLHYMFMREKTIGHDDRYGWYIFLMPTLIGALLILIYQRKFITTLFKELNGFEEYIVEPFVLMCVVLLLSYLTFGNVTNIVWEYINKREAEQHMPETFYCPITRFIDGRKSNEIQFQFKGEHENVHVSYQTIKPYLEVNPKDYELEVIVRKGLWNYYLVEDWNIKKQKK